MSTPEEKLERLLGLLDQAKAAAEAIEIPKCKKSAADYFMQTLLANVNNDKLTDANFRQFVKNSIQVQGIKAE